ncbi:hypothetical protein KFU94_32520 [Chloroflexi bacterium TSY]|nr:hypothetical protein [Chloroflexi bacterium TSY]
MDSPKNQSSTIQKRDPSQSVAAKRAEGDRLAWSFVGCLNGVAFLIIGIIVASIAGYNLTITWRWIVGVTIVVVALAVLQLWQIMRHDRQTKQKGS